MVADKGEFMFIGIEVQAGKCCILKFDEESQYIEIPAIKHEINKNDNSISSVIEFQSNIQMFFQDEKPDLICLCEASAGADKKRIRMELCVLIAAEMCSIPYKTYLTSVATRYINSGFVKDYGMKFDEWFASKTLPKKYEKIAATLMHWKKAWKR